jgi:hypothetical protein
VYNKVTKQTKKEMRLAMKLNSQVKNLKNISDKLESKIVAYEIKITAIEEKACNDNDRSLTQGEWSRVCDYEEKIKALFKEKEVIEKAIKLLTYYCD